MGKGFARNHESKTMRTFSYSRAIAICRGLGLALLHAAKSSLYFIASAMKFLEDSLLGLVGFGYVYFLGASEDCAWTLSESGAAGAGEADADDTGLPGEADAEEADADDTGLPREADAGEADADPGLTGTVDAAEADADPGLTGKAEVLSPAACQKDL